MNTQLTRRRFIAKSAFGASSLFLTGLASFRARGGSANEKLNIAMIGVANQAAYNLSNVSTENIVALCDVDDTLLAAAAQKHPGAKTYNDFRRLLDQKGIDAVVVATPDHTHAVASVAALNSGRHLYCEKPLTHTVSECRAVVEAARQNKRVTQLGTADSRRDELPPGRGVSAKRRYRTHRGGSRLGERYLWLRQRSA